MLLFSILLFRFSDQDKSAHISRPLLYMKYLPPADPEGPEVLVADHSDHLQQVEDPELLAEQVAGHSEPELREAAPEAAFPAVLPQQQAVWFRCRRW